MPDITIDTQILLCGSGKSTVSIDMACELLLHIKDSNAVHLALDDKGQIKAEYDKHFGKDFGCLAFQMLARLASSNRIVRYKWENKLWNTRREKLQKKHRFHSADYKFLRTAEASESKILVAQERGYRPDVCSTIKACFGISVATAADAHRHLVNLNGESAS
jgi:hypothetical protein